MCREPSNWSLINDEHAFRVGGPGLYTDVTCRLQVLKCTHDDLLLVAVQSQALDRCGSAVNHAERIAKGAVEQVLPGYSRKVPPDLVIVLLGEGDDGGAYETVAGFEPLDGVPPSGRQVTAAFGVLEEWEAVVSAHVEMSRGDRFIPGIPEPWPWVTGWRLLHLAGPVEVRPFRKACLAADRSWLTSLRLWARRGSSQCCFYHQTDWAEANQLVQEAISEALPQGHPVREKALDILASSQPEKVAARSLLRDPINVSWPDPGVINGQHRIAAMRDQGVAFVWAQCGVLREDQSDFLGATGGWVEGDEDVG